MPWDCPKRMVFGPCGGVREDGGCEVDGAQRCTFVDGPLPRWNDGATVDASRAAPAMTGPAPEAPGWVVTDLHVAPSGPSLI